MNIPFHKPHITHAEIDDISSVTMDEDNDYSFTVTYSDVDDDLSASVSSSTSDLSVSVSSNNNESALITIDPADHYYGNSTVTVTTDPTDIFGFVKNANGSIFNCLMPRRIFSFSCEISKILHFID